MAITDVVVPALISGVTGIVTWAVSKKKYATELEQLKNEVNASELQNVEKSIEIYRNMVDDLGNRYDRLAQKFQDVLDENENLKNEISKLKQEISKLSQR